MTTSQQGNPNGWTTIKCPRVSRPTYQALVAIQGLWAVAAFVAPQHKIAVYLAVPLGGAVASIARRLDLRRAPTPVAFLASVGSLYASLHTGTLIPLTEVALDRLIVAGALAALYGCQELLAMATADSSPRGAGSPKQSKRGQ